MADKTLAVVLGIRPDVIRASIILDILRSALGHRLRFIWSGQHYSDNLKDIFFRELSVSPPEIELGATGESDAELLSSVVSGLSGVLDDLRPEAAVFLGDTNTVMGCLAAAQLNIPIVHIEGCMRSYDWRMPEEKYRTVTDHLSDVIYAYLDEYKQQGVAEGLNPDSIVVTGNPIVDVIDRSFEQRRPFYVDLANSEFFASRGLRRNDYFLMTCHRRENVHDRSSLQAILTLLESSPRPVFFPASYRTQRIIREEGLRLPERVVMVDPVGYQEFLALLVNSCGVITDSGTVVEEACILGVGSLQMRRSTERPQVYDVGASVKFDPSEQQTEAGGEFFHRLEALSDQQWEQPFGDGLASERIAEDLLVRFEDGGFSRHEPRMYHLDISRSFSGEVAGAEGS